MGEQIQFHRTADEVPLKPAFADVLASWGRRLAARGLDCGSSGYRHGLGFIVTAEGARLGVLAGADFVFVEQCGSSEGRMDYRGAGAPDATSPLHAAVYESRSGAIFSFLVKCPLSEKACVGARIPWIAGAGGSTIIEAARAVQGHLGEGNLLALENVGLLAFGCTAEDAGVLIEGAWGRLGGR